MKLTDGILLLVCLLAGLAIVTNLFGRDPAAAPRPPTPGSGEEVARAAELREEIRLAKARIAALESFVINGVAGYDNSGRSVSFARRPDSGYPTSSPRRPGSTTGGRRRGRAIRRSPGDGSRPPGRTASARSWP